jgi:hypothetical protein
MNNSQLPDYNYIDDLFILQNTNLQKPVVP